jgi:hypothetical protein
VSSLFFLVSIGEQGDGASDSGRGILYGSRERGECQELKEGVVR